MKRQHKIIAVLITLTSIVLGSLLYYSMVLAQGPGDYDPWCDINDDGEIDMRDIAAVARKFGTSGTPIIKAGMDYDSNWLDITDKAGQYFTVTHNLNKTEIIVEIQGRMALDSGTHQKHIGGTELAMGWNKTYGGVNDDQAYVVIQTCDGGFAIVGFTDSFGAGDYDSMLIKVDYLGEVQWNQTYGDTGNDITSTVVQSTDGGYAMLGYTDNPSLGLNDFYFVKTDASGNKLWNKTYGGVNHDFGYSIIQTSDGGYALCGSTGSFGSGQDDIWLVKIDALGNMEWNKTYGGTNNEFCTSIIQTDDGGYAIAGVTRSFGAGAEDFWLVKTDSNGNTQWSRTYGGTAQDNLMDLTQTLDGGYALVGHTQSFGFGFWDWWFVKTDSNGNHQWNTTFGGIGDDRLQHLAQTSDLGYILCGYTNSHGAGNYDYWLIKTNTLGDAQWNKTYGGSSADCAYGIITTNDGGYALIGRTESFSLGSNDYWLIKTDSEGNPADSFDIGLAWINSTENTITLYRGIKDPYWNYIRIYIW
ncbi:MAG: hypothetical protein PVF96_06415 [Candidatus Bathyarchaeota archaeon]